MRRAPTAGREPALEADQRLVKSSRKQSLTTVVHDLLLGPMAFGPRDTAGGPPGRIRVKLARPRRSDRPKQFRVNQHRCVGPTHATRLSVRRLGRRPQQKRLSVRSFSSAPSAGKDEVGRRILANRRFLQCDCFSFHPGSSPPTRRDARRGRMRLQRVRWIYSSSANHSFGMAT